MVRHSFLESLLDRNKRKESYNSFNVNVLFFFAGHLWISFETNTKLVLCLEIFRIVLGYLTQIVKMKMKHWHKGKK